MSFAVRKARHAWRTTADMFIPKGPSVHWLRHLGHSSISCVIVQARSYFSSQLHLSSTHDSLICDTSPGPNVTDFSKAIMSNSFLWNVLRLSKGPPVSSVDSPCPTSQPLGLGYTTKGRHRTLFGRPCNVHRSHVRTGGRLLVMAAIICVRCFSKERVTVEQILEAISSSPAPARSSGGPSGGDKGERDEGLSLPLSRAVKSTSH